MRGADVATRAFMRSLVRLHYLQTRIFPTHAHVCVCVCLLRTKIMARRCPPFPDALADLRTVKRDEFTRVTSPFPPCCSRPQLILLLLFVSRLRRNKPRLTSRSNFAKYVSKATQIHRRCMRRTGKEDIL